MTGGQVIGFWIGTALLVAIVAVTAWRLGVEHGEAGMLDAFKAFGCIVDHDPTLPLPPINLEDQE